MIPTILAAWAIALMLTACGSKGTPAAADAYPVKIETVDGVRTVVNPAFPKEGVVRYTLLDDLTLGGEEGEGEIVLNRPFDLRVDAQGNIFVLDWGDVQFKVFAPDGRLLRAFGKEGQGPGELPSPPISIWPPTGGSSCSPPGSTRWFSSTARGSTSRASGWTASATSWASTGTTASITARC